MFADEFPLDAGISYLNHAAVAPWPARTARVVQAFAEENSRLGSRHYDRWLGTETELRERLRKLIHASSTEEIALLKNTSEALSVVAHDFIFLLVESKLTDEGFLIPFFTQTLPVALYTGVIA